MSVRLTRGAGCGLAIPKARTTFALRRTIRLYGVQIRRFDFKIAWAWHGPVALLRLEFGAQIADIDDGVW